MTKRASVLGGGFAVRAQRSGALGGGGREFERRADVGGAFGVMRQSGKVVAAFRTGAQHGKDARVYLGTSVSRQARPGLLRARARVES